MDRASSIIPCCGSLADFSVLIPKLDKRALAFRLFGFENAESVDLKEEETEATEEEAFNEDGTVTQEKEEISV